MAEIIPRDWRIIAKELALETDPSRALKLRIELEEAIGRRNEELHANFNYSRKAAKS